jgi:type 2 lantibiotic biosynthesis protein LanM
MEQEMPLTDEKLRQIFVGAATLAERMQWASATTMGADAALEGASDSLPDFVSRWQTAVAGGSTARWSRRLAWDGWSEEQAARAAVSLPPDVTLPAWSVLLREVSDQARRAATASDALAPSRIAFLELLQPFVRVAEGYLERNFAEIGDRLSPVARAALMNGLATQLSSLAVRTLFHEFQAARLTGEGGATSVLQSALNGGSNRRYRAFVTQHLADGLESLLATYPVLARLLATRTEDWVANCERFLTRLHDDWPSLERVFAPTRGQLPPVSNLETNLSDSHRGGATVSVLHFGNGLRIVYKPRGLRIDECFYALVEQLNTLHDGPSLRSLIMLARDEYGWVEFAVPAECASGGEVDAFFERGGMLVALSYVLGASDLHSANVLACGEHPVLIDLEVMCNPLVDTGIAPEKSGRRHAHATVLSSALLPSRSSAGAVDFVDGGLLDRTERQIYTRETLRYANTDMMSWGTYQFIGGGRDNVPTLQGVTVRSAEYLSALTRGFLRMYATLRDHRETLLAADGPLRRMEAASVRVVHRPTSVYDRLSLRTLHPRYLRCGVDRSIEFERLVAETLVQRERPALWALFSAEQRELERGDIPVFFTQPGSRTLCSGGGSSADESLLESGFDGVLDRLTGLGPDDLKQQLDLLRIAFAGAEDYAVRLAERELPVPEDSDALVLAEAERIGETLMRLRQVGTERGWIGLSGRDARSTRLQSLDAGMFDGRTGIALFLATLGVVARREVFRAVAEETLDDVRRSVRDPHRARALVARLGIGGAYGVGGVIYALTRCALLFDDESYLADAAAAAALVSDDELERDRSHDLMFGSAGALISLLSLYHTTRDAGTLTRAVRCGDRLVRLQCGPTDAYAGHWRTGGDAPETGVAHGTAGILLALTRLWHVHQSAPLAAAIQRATVALSAQFDSQHNNWHDAVGVPSQSAASSWSSWCRGAAGIGMVHLCLRADGHAESDAQLAAACENVSERDFPSKDHLCCGTSGRIDFLVTASQRLGRPDLLARARLKSLQIRRSRVARGSYSTGYVTELSPGLFQGIAGVGYGMLRVARPASVPSVLMWE